MMLSKKCFGVEDSFSWASPVDAWLEGQSGNYRCQRMLKHSQDKVHGMLPEISIIFKILLIA